MNKPLNVSQACHLSQTEEAFPLSAGQEGIWFVEQMHQGSGAYNIPEAWELHGEVNCEALQSALDELAGRHETLRTRFVLRDGKPVQIVNARGTLPLEVFDLRASERCDRESEALLALKVSTPFNLAVAPLARAVLIRLSETKSILLLNLHHIISDAWSLEVLRRELFQSYRCAVESRPSDLPPLPVQFVDFVLWQRDTFRRPLLNQYVKTWEKRLSGAPSGLGLVPDRNCAAPSLKGATVFHQLPEQLSARIQIAASQHRVSLYTFVLSAFHVLLHRYTGEEDIVVGSPFSGRTRGEIDGLIGYFVNTHALRTLVRSERTFVSLLSDVRDTVLAAEEIQEAPFSEIVEALGVTGGCRHPVFQVVFGMENEVKNEELLPGVRGQLMDVATETSKFDLTVLAAKVGEAIRLRWEFSTEMFDERSVRRMARQMEVLLDAVCLNPDVALSQLPMGEKSESALIQRWAEGPVASKRFLNVVEAFETWFESTPDSVAIVQEEVEITYGKLNAYANAVANRLIENGTTPGQRVGLCMERSPAMVVSMLGVLKAGAVLVPLDGTNPSERMSFIVKDTSLSCVLVDDHGAQLISGTGVPLVRVDALDSLEACKNPGIDISADAPAYIMYTSGSTGTPKGVAVPHKAILRLVLAPNYLTISKEDVFLQLAPVSFDASTLEIWGALLNGAKLVVAPEMTSLADIVRIVRQHTVTTLWLTAGLFHQMVDFGIGDLRCLKNLLAGGEELSVSHVVRALASLPETRLINGYGPTENTTFTCCFAVPRDWTPRRSVPIGRPVSGTKVLILDKNLQPAPVGVPGELYTGGDGLAIGYWNRPDLDRQLFQTVDGAGRLYRTGDRVRWLDDGTIEFLGRIDQQLKIRGFRVEPGEIEAALCAHPLVKQAFVAARQSTDGSKILAGYYVPRNVDVPGEESLRGFLGQRLPGYMVPTFLTPLDALPLNANGKVDWRNLPEPRHVPTSMFRGPQTRTEKALSSIFCEVLGLDEVSTTDNFFRLGGHSLLATQVIARVYRDLGTDLPLHSLFENPSVTSLAGEIDRLGAGVGPQIRPHVDPERAAATLARLDQLDEKEIDELLEQLKVRDVLQ